MTVGEPAGTPRARSSFPRSVGFALRGLRDAARHRNMRIQLVAGVLAAGFAAAAPLSPVERAVLLFCVFAVVAAEAANTALEAAVDLHGGAPTEGARLAKDAAAGAVLLLAVGSLAVLAAIVEGRWEALQAAQGALLVPAGAAAVVAVAAALLPGPAARRAPLRAALLLLGLGGWVLLLVGSASLPGALASGLLLALSAGAGPTEAPR